MPLNVEDVSADALKKFGAEKQLDMSLEELAELMKAIVKYRRHEWNVVWRIKVLEETADTEIQCFQLRLMLSNPEEYGQIMQQKLANLKSIIREDSPLRGLKQETKGEKYDKRRSKKSMDNTETE